MSATENSTLKLVKSPHIVADRNAAALADIFKALKSLTFYPEGHPQREESLRGAIETLQRLLNGRDIVFSVSRTGFTTTDGGAPVGSNTKAQGLARELFVRRVQRLTILADVGSDDLMAFLQLLTMDPRKVQDAGGIEELMHRCAIRCIWANEVDLEVIQRKQKELEEEDSPPHMLEEGMLSVPDLLPSLEISRQQELPFVELLDLLDEEPSDARYLQLAKTVVSRAEKLMNEGDLEPVVMAILLVRRHGEDVTRSEFQREYATFTFEQLAGGVMGDYLLDQLQEGDHESNEWIYEIIRQLGAKIAYAIIQRICLAEGLMARKALANALIKIGEPAIPPLIVMLKDERWYVVRNMVAMLGEIGNRDWVDEIRGAAAHLDPRVRKETIRTLAKIGGPDAEQTIIRLLDDQDQGIVRQAIVSLGMIKCRAATEPLLQIVQQRDRFLGTLAVKKDAVQALGLIGNRSVTPHLLAILTGAHFLAWRRWEELKIAVASALGQLGDESALPVLRSGAMRRGALGAACNDAVDSIERLSEGAP